MQRFEGAVVVVTGASRGIGLAVARRVVDEGGRVVITARSPEPLAAAATELGGPDTARWHAGRGGDAEHRAAVLDSAAAWGGITHLVANAGINPVAGPLLDADLALAHKVIETNALDVLAWVREARAAGMAERGGSVVAVSSVAGLSASPPIALYGVSKAALLAVVAQLALELAPALRVNAVAPAVVRTDFARALYEGREADVAAGYPLGRLGRPDDVAAAVAFLLSRDAAWITGQTLVVDGGASLHPIA